MTTDTRALAREMVERLRRTKTQHRMTPLFGGAVSIPDFSEEREVPVNPDGPEAADFIEKALSLTPTDTRGWEEADVDALVDAALGARVPGGAEVAAWLPSTDDFRPNHTARAVMKAAVEAVLSTLTPPPHDPEEGAPHV